MKHNIMAGAAAAGVLLAMAEESKRKERAAFNALDIETQRQITAERIKLMDEIRLRRMQLLAQDALRKKHRKQQRADVALVGSRQYKKLVKQARRDAKAAHTPAE